MPSGPEGELAVQIAVSGETALKIRTTGLIAFVLRDSLCEHLARQNQLENANVEGALDRRKNISCLHFVISTIM